MCGPQPVSRATKSKRLSASTDTHHSDIVLSVTPFASHRTSCSTMRKNNSRELPPIVTRICIMNMKLVFFPLASAFVQLDSGISFRDLT